MAPNVFDIQMEFAANNGWKNNIIWDLLSVDQAHVLKKKIKALIPDQETGKSKIEEMRETLFQSVWAQRKYTNKNSLSSIFYVLVTPSKDGDKLTALSSAEFSFHPVFRTRRCIDNNDSSNCCMIYIDEVGRVYQNWKSYINNNVLPRGIMVAPRRGVYTFDDDNMVNLEIRPTPLSSLQQVVLEGADKSTMVVGLATAGISILGLCTALVAAPVVAAAAVTGAACAGYSALRSGSNLVDRKKHEQSIALSDRQARGSWLGVVGGAVGLGASSSTRLLQTAATAGKEISADSSVLRFNDDEQVAVLTVNGLNVTSIVLSGTGIANGVLDIILKVNDDDEITILEIGQLAASLIIFTHSVNNFRLASNLVQEAQTNKIQSFRESLSNRQRKMFDKMSKETVRIKGVQQGKMDVIRGINEIPSKQVFNDLHKINRQLSGKNVRASFGGSGKPVVLNNEVPVDTKVLRNSVQHKIGPDVLSGVKQPIPATYEQPLSNAKTSAPQLIFPKNNTNLLEQFQKAKLILPYGVGILNLADLGNLLFRKIRNADNFQDAVLKMAQEFSEKIIHYIFHLAKKFITDVEYVNILLKQFISTESVLWEIIQVVLKDYKTVSIEILRKEEKKILDYLRKFFASKRSKSKDTGENSDKAAGSSDDMDQEETVPRPKLYFPNKVDDKSTDENYNIFEKLTREELKEGHIEMPSGRIIQLAEFGPLMFEQVSDAENFAGIIYQVAEAYAEETFIFIMQLLQTFIETELHDIHGKLKTPISTEEVMFRMQSIVEKYENNSYEFLSEQSTIILKDLEKYFLSLNPNVDRALLKHCDECLGYYYICEL